MNRSLAKELKPLLLPWCVAAAGGLIPTDDSVASGFGVLLNFGGFAVLAAMVFGIEFQERTLPLLLSQPIQRTRLWFDKLSAIALAAGSLALLNWRVHLVLSDLGPVVTSLLILAIICSAGFWVQITRSAVLGIGLATVTQLIVFAGLTAVVGRFLGLGLPARVPELFQVLSVAGIIYCAAFAWLGREFWRRHLLLKAAVTLLLLAGFRVGQMLITDSNARTGPTDLCLAALFVLTTSCSVGWWTMLARTTIGGAVLTMAYQFFSVLVVAVALSWFTGTNMWFEDGRLLGIVILGAPIYSILFLRAGLRKFQRFEIKDAQYTEIKLDKNFPVIGSVTSGLLRCRAGEALLNLIRKELQLQKPLLLLAGIFCACWAAVFGLHWVQPHQGYAKVADVLICLYAPLSLALAGCISLGEEKNLGIVGWNLTQPTSAARQWIVKLLVALCAGVVLGLVLPLSLAWVSARTTDTSLLMHDNENGWQALAGISGGLFLLSFWAATLVPNTVRAALTAIVALAPIFVCAIAGSWCAQQTCASSESLRAWLNLGVGPQVSDAMGLLGFVIPFAGVALIQSLLQFRRIRIPGSAVVVHSLLLGVGTTVGAFCWTAILISAGK